MYRVSSDVEPVLIVLTAVIVCAEFKSATLMPKVNCWLDTPRFEPTLVMYSVVDVKKLDVAEPQSET